MTSSDYSNTEHMPLIIPIGYRNYCKSSSADNSLITFSKYAAIYVAEAALFTTLPHICEQICG